MSLCPGLNQLAGSLDVIVGTNFSLEIIESG